MLSYDQGHLYDRACVPKGPHEISHDDIKCGLAIGVRSQIGNPRYIISQYGVRAFDKLATSLESNDYIFVFYVVFFYFLCLYYLTRTMFLSARLLELGRFSYYL